MSAACADPNLALFWIAFVLGVVVGAFAMGACATRAIVRRSIKQ